jgi:hypothetical protein
MLERGWSFDAMNICHSSFAIFHLSLSFIVFS